MKSAIVRLSSNSSFKRLWKSTITSAVYSWRESSLRSDLHYEAIDRPDLIGQKWDIQINEDFFTSRTAHEQSEEALLQEATHSLIGRAGHE